MGEKKILTEDMIDEKLRALTRSEVTYIDPMKMAVWSLERACSMVDNTVSPKTVERAIADHQLKAYKPGSRLGVVPNEFLVWYKRFMKQ